ncbi:MAG: MarR family transcriptional regulator [Oscillospiraceae bacterium]|nr:MarR family transcriptional regulator [Oscillospiraceae bacterium]
MGHFFVLYIGKHPGCSPSELTKALRVDWGHSQRSVEKLVREGFVIKERPGEGGRAYRLTLTARGQEVFEESQRVFFEWDEQKLSSLSGEERLQLLPLLEKAMYRSAPGEACEGTAKAKKKKF